MGIWRKPATESKNLYPGLCVHDGRVSGSITAECTRLPLWCLVYTAITEDWDSVESSWSPSQYGLTAVTFGMFLMDLLEPRGEFARLLLLLANAERIDREREYELPWWERPAQRDAVRKQLKRCLTALGES